MKKYGYQDLIVECNNKSVKLQEAAKDKIYQLLGQFRLTDIFTKMVSTI